MTHKYDMTFYECCRLILANRNEKALKYAVNYASAGLHMSGEMAKVQALYILSNMSSWRGDTAKAVRQSLKAIAK